MEIAIYLGLAAVVWIGAGMIGNILLTVSLRRATGTRVSYCLDVTILLGPFILLFGIVVVLYVFGCELADWIRKRKE